MTKTPLSDEQICDLATDAALDAGMPPKFMLLNAGKFCAFARAILDRAPDTQVAPSPPPRYPKSPWEARWRRLHAACVIEHGPQDYEPECPICEAMCEQQTIEAAPAAQSLPVAWMYGERTSNRSERVWFQRWSEGDREGLTEIPLYAEPLTRGLVEDPSPMPPESAGSHTPTDISAQVAPDSLVARLRRRIADELSVEAADRIEQLQRERDGAMAIIELEGNRNDELNRLKDRLERVTQAADDVLNRYLAEEACDNLNNYGKGALAGVRETIDAIRAEKDS